jgi:hypothetical protein
MAGGLGGMFLVVVFGGVAACGAALIPRLYRAGSAGQAGRRAAGPPSALAAMIRRLRP